MIFFTLIFCRALRHAGGHRLALCHLPGVARQVGKGKSLFELGREGGVFGGSVPGLWRRSDGRRSNSRKNIFRCSLWGRTTRFRSQLSEQGRPDFVFSVVVCRHSAVGTALSQLPRLPLALHGAHGRLS